MKSLIALINAHNYFPHIFEKCMNIIFYVTKNRFKKIMTTF